MERSSNRRLAAKEEAAAWVRRADHTRADVVAARRAGGLDLALAWASMRIKLVSSQALGIGLHAYWQPNSKTY